MIQFLKMDLIAACLAVTSLFGLQRPAVQPLAVAPPMPAPPIQPPPAPLTAKPVHPLRAMAVNLGIASWYGSVFDGRRTANGDIFDKDQMTACHKTLPFGTIVRVVDVHSGKSVVVRINDRGVLAPGRIIDLSSAAAESLGIMRSGLAKVRLDVLKRVVGAEKKQPASSVPLAIQG